MLKNNLKDELNSIWRELAVAIVNSKNAVAVFIDDDDDEDDYY